MTTDLDLASIKARDADSAATWFKVPALGACGRAFIDRRWLLGEIERLERERAEWSGTAAQRLRETQMALLERDCAVEEVKRLDGEVKRLMGFMPEHDTRESYRCTECGAFHLRHPDVPARLIHGYCPCGNNEPHERTPKCDV